MAKQSLAFLSCCNCLGSLALGEMGAIEALFIITEKDEDRIIQANALWALGNLAWDRNNSERIGR